MRIVDDHAERLAKVDTLHPATDPRVTIQPMTDLVERQPDGDTGGRRGQRIGRVPAAAQLQIQRERPKRCGPIDP